MRFVAAPLVSEVIAFATVSILAIFGHKAFVASPGLDLGAVHAEVLANEQLTLIGLLHDLAEQFDSTDGATAVVRQSRSLGDCIMAVMVNFMAYQSNAWQYTSLATAKKWFSQAISKTP